MAFAGVALHRAPIGCCLGDEDVLLAPGRKDFDVMGCRTSKVLPEPPADVQLDLVKKSRATSD